MLEPLLFTLGFLYLLSLLLSFSQLLKSLTSRPNLSLYKDSWALITACTDGIGLGFSQTLAANGINIIQVGRNPSKLSQTALDLTSKYGIQVKNITKDFFHCTSDPNTFFSEIFNECQDLDVSILVNNVGYGTPKPFVSSPLSLILQQNALNIWPIVYLSRLFYGKLSRRKGFGCIVNLSSVASWQPSGIASVYSAGKSFDLVFSRICDGEGKVKVMCLKPGYVYTPMTKGYRFKPLEICAKECAVGALSDLGVINETCGHWKHWISYTAASLSSPIASYLEFLIK